MPKQFINSNIIKGLLGLVVVTMPLKSNFNSMSIIILLLYSIFFLYTKRKEVTFIPSKKVIILVIPFLAILLQGFYSEWTSFSKNVIRSLPLIIFPFLFFYLQPWLNKKQVKAVFKTLVFSAIGYSLFLLVVAFYRQIDFKPDFSIINWYFFTYYDFTEALGVHPTYFGMYLCLAFAILFYDFLKAKNIGVNVLLLSFLALIIFLLGSRIALVCLILITIALLWRKFKFLEKKRKILLLLFFTASPILIFNFIPIVKERMIDMTFGLKDSYQYAKYGDEGKNNNQNGGLAPRIKIWSCAIDVGKHNYLFGSGFGTTQKRLNACYLSKDLIEFSKQDYQTHSQYFNNYARGGIIGFFVLLLLYFYTLIFSLKRKQILHLSLIVIIIIASLTENILNRHFGIVFFAFFNSLFFFSANNKNI
tara:strand:- start:3007 stop:4263 length:1257 start_codon:yes stop_codon:yes gene_type:complete